MSDQNSDNKTNNTLYALYYHNKEKTYNYIISVYNCFYKKHSKKEIDKCNALSPTSKYFIHRVIDILELYLYFSKIQLSNDQEKDGKSLVYVSITCVWIVQKFLDDYAIKLKDICNITKLNKYIIIDIEKDILFNVFNFNIFKTLVR